MIDVNVIERKRRFDVFVGEKKIGHVCVYNEGRVAAYGQTTEGNEKFLETYSTLKKATNRILRYDGFGNAHDVRVIRASGGHKG